MSGTVDMFREAAEPNGRDRFSCSFAVWELLEEIARAFGWQPKGTTYLTLPKQKIDAPARHNYQPGDALDRKRIEAEDAVAWARALEVAKRSPHFATMMKARSTATGTSAGAAIDLTPAMLDEFIAFAYGGTFTFAISRNSSGT